MSTFTGGSLERVLNPTTNIVSGNTGLGKVIRTDPLSLIKKKPVSLAPVLAMPDQDAIAAAKKKSVADQYGRQGRASTILSGQQDTLG